MASLLAASEERTAHELAEHGYHHERLEESTYSGIGPFSRRPSQRGTRYLLALSCRKSDLRFGGMVPDAENGPGFLAEVLHKVADRELNVGPTYSITDNRIAITADDFGKLRDVLQDLASAARRP